MPTIYDHGFPEYSDTDAMPDWDIFANTLGAATDAALSEVVQDAKDDDSVDAIADLSGLTSWRGRQVFVDESDLVYLHDGTGYFAVGGKLPFYFGSRADSAIGTGGSPQEWITTTTSSRGVTMTSGVLTFATVGIYRIDSTVIWEANGNGQRNLGLDAGAGITILGPQEAVLFPNAFVEDSQTYTSYFQVTTPGATATPYVTHNTGLALDVYGTTCVMWVSA